MIDQLIKEEPNNPFFHELKGQVLLENSRVAELIGPYRRSVELLPDFSSAAQFTRPCADRIQRRQGAGRSS